MVLQGLDLRIIERIGRREQIKGWAGGRKASAGLGTCPSWLLLVGAEKSVGGRGSGGRAIWNEDIFHHSLVFHIVAVVCALA